MSLIKKISEDRDARLLAESEVRLAQERDEQQRRERCLTIVTKSLIRTAEKLDEELEPLGNPVGLPSYYVLGGVVIVVQLFSAVQADDVSDEQKLVVTQNYVSVVGADKRSDTSVEQVRVGTLAWLDYDGLYKAISNAPSYLDFNADRFVGASMCRIIPTLGGGTAIRPAPKDNSICFNSELDCPFLIVIHSKKLYYIRDKICRSLG